MVERWIPDRLVLQINKSSICAGAAAAAADDDDVMYYYKAQLAVTKMAPVTPHILFLWDGS